MDLMELLDHSIAYAGKNLRWALGLSVFGMLLFGTWFIKDNGAGPLVLILVLAFGLGIYFLPAIKAYQENKTNRQAILILNLFLGWTLVGWVVALVWACTRNDSHHPVAAGAGFTAVLCAACGKYSPSGSPFCGQCGKRVGQT